MARRQARAVGGAWLRLAVEERRPNGFSLFICKAQTKLFIKFGIPVGGARDSCNPSLPNPLLADRQRSARLRLLPPPPITSYPSLHYHHHCPILAPTTRKPSLAGSLRLRQRLGPHGHLLRSSQVTCSQIASKIRGDVPLAGMVENPGNEPTIFLHFPESQVWEVWHFIWDMTVTTWRTCKHLRAPIFGTSTSHAKVPVACWRCRAAPVSPVLSSAADLVAHDGPPILPENQMRECR